MNRLILQAILYITLCPLLVAQQAVPHEAPASVVTPAETFFAYRSSLNLGAELGFDPARVDSSYSPTYGSLYGFAIIPFEVPLKLIPVDPAAWANATIGSTLTFRVVNDVIVRRGVFNRSSYADAYAGTLIEAKVIRIREGKIRTRQGRAEPRVKEVMVGKSIKLELESSPGGGARFSGIAKNLVVWSVKGPYMVVVLPPEYALLLIACSTGCDL
jgi:hypothetical protein